jgi:hypothetical protein
MGGRYRAGEGSRVVRSGPHRQSKGEIMDSAMRDKLLRILLVVFGAIFILVYPISLVWPSGWVWSDGYSQTYVMILGVYATLGVFLLLAARNPAEHRSLIAFTAWSSVVHGAIMAVQAYQDSSQTGHLIGDVPALIAVFIVLLLLSPRGATA